MLRKRESDIRKHILFCTARKWCLRWHPNEDAGKEREIENQRKCSMQTVQCLVDNSGGYQGEKKAKDTENAREEDGERGGDREWYNMQSRGRAGSV